MSEHQLLSIGYALFMVLILGEFLWSRWRKDGGYRWSQVVVNVGHGVVFQVVDGFTKTLVIWPALYLGSIWSPWMLSVDSLGAWVVGLLAYDFLSYWRHRHFHRVGVLWAVHGVHHAATDFNFAAALRQAGLQGIFGWPWMLPLALFVPAEMFVGLVVLDFLYQFVQHTRYVPKLGPIEWLMNTPSHHRVHHGTESAYLDKNYGGIFIIWDRLFGTFESEGQEPTYGLTVPLHSLNPIWGNLALFHGLWRSASIPGRLKDRLGVLLGPPTEAGKWAPQGGMESGEHFDEGSISTSRMRYVVMSFAALPIYLSVLVWIPGEHLVLRVSLAAFLLFSSLSLAALLEGRDWARRSEVPRVLVGAAVFGGLRAVEDLPTLALAVAGGLCLTALGAVLAWASRDPVTPS